MTRDARERLVAALARRGLAPCGDSSCLLAPPSGMATNGGCSCPLVRSPREFAAGTAARALAAVVRDLHAEVERLRDAIATQATNLECVLTATPFPPAGISRSNAAALAAHLRGLLT